MTRRRTKPAAPRNTKTPASTRRPDPARITPRPLEPVVPPITVQTANARDRRAGRRPVVSIRMEPRLLDALDRIAKSRPYGWSHEPTPRSMLIEEAVTKYAADNDAAFKEWHSQFRRYS